MRYSFLFILFFFHLCLFCKIRFQYSQLLVIFILSKRSDVFLIWQLWSFFYFCFPTFHYRHGTFFNAKLHSYTLVVLSYCLNQSSRFSFFFYRYLDIIHIHMKWVTFSFDLVTVLSPLHFLSIQLPGIIAMNNNDESGSSLENNFFDLHLYEDLSSYC